MSPTRAFIFAGLACAFATAFGAPAAESKKEVLEPARFGYSRSIMQGLNEADFRSAMLVYARTISNDAGVNARTEQQIFDTVADMADALRSGSVNLVTGPAREILSLPPDTVQTPFVVSANAQNTGVEFVLVVRRDRRAEHLAQLRNCSLAIWDCPTTALAGDWLELILARDSLGAPGEFFSQVRRCPKSVSAMLPVFFQQLDAGIVTRRAFEVLCEMNPQLATDLRIVATSPRIQSIFTAFRRGIDPQLRENILNTMFSIGSTPAGRQVLMLYQTDSLAFCEPAVVAATRDLLQEHDRLTGNAPRAPRPDESQQP